MVNLNILSQRYVTPNINDLFSEVQGIVFERELWIAVMKAQKELGLNIPGEDIEKYERAKNEVDLNAIEKREKVLRHDVKAKIEQFVEVSSAKEHIHKGMTSRDLTDNVEQMRIRCAAQIIFGKYVSVLRHMSQKISEYEDITLTARTHHQAAQPTLLGRRIAMYAEELYGHAEAFEYFIENYPLRGIKGPVGTQQDMLSLLGSKEKVFILEDRVMELLGFKRTLHATGQVYPRSLDFALVSQLALLSSGCENFANGMRLMSGYELVTEGFKEGQVGSTAMPHKMNTRSSERIWGFSELLKMYADGASRLSGQTWEEGDVSCSVVRRVIIPDAFYASDGLCETTLTVLNEMGAYPAVISKEVDRYLPFLATTEIIMEAIKAGVGREQAHKAIKKYAVAEALKMRQVGSEKNNLASLLANDPVFLNAGITNERLDNLMGERQRFIGNAREQMDYVCTNIDKKFVKRFPEQAAYEPLPIL